MKKKEVKKKTTEFHGVLIGRVEEKEGIRSKTRNSRITTCHTFFSSSFPLSLSSSVLLRG